MEEQKENEVVVLEPVAPIVPVKKPEPEGLRDALGRFQPGIPSISPGKPKGGGMGLTTMLRRKLAEVPPGQMKTYSELFLDSLLQKAYVDQDPQSMKLVMNYVEGLPRAVIGIEGGEEGEPIKISIETQSLVNLAIAKYLNVNKEEE